VILEYYEENSKFSFSWKAKLPCPPNIFLSEILGQESDSFAIRFLFCRRKRAYPYPTRGGVGKALHNILLGSDNIFFGSQNVYCLLSPEIGITVKTNTYIKIMLNTSLGLLQLRSNF